MTCIETPTGTNIGENLGIYFRTNNGTVVAQGTTFDAYNTTPYDSAIIMYTYQFRKGGFEYMTDYEGLGYYYTGSSYNYGSIGLDNIYLYLVAETYNTISPGTYTYTGGKFLITLFGC